MSLHKKKYQEHIEQESLVKWFRLQYPQFKDLLIHVPNGQNVGLRQGARLKGMGLCSGFPDLFLFVPVGAYNGMAIEMKSSSGRPSKRQLDVILQLQNQGYCARIAYGFADAAAAIKEYMYEGSHSRA